MKKINYTTLIITIIITSLFTSCDFVDKDGNNVKFDLVEDNNLLKDKKLKTLLDEYTTALDIKNHTIESFTKTRKIAAKITSYIESRIARLEEKPKDCINQLKKLKEADAELDTTLQKLSELEGTLLHDAMGVGLIPFGGYIMHVLNAQMSCSISVNVTK